MAIGSPDISGQVLGATRCLSVTFDGGGSVPTADSKYRMYVPYACTITGATMVGDASGSAVIDVWVQDYPTFPTNTESITAAAPPTLSSEQYSQDLTLTGWTTYIPAGSWVFFNLDSASTLLVVTLTLTVGA